MEIVEINVRRNDIFSWLKYVKRGQNLYLPSGTIEELIGYMRGYTESYVYEESSSNPWITYESFKYFVSQKNKKIWESNEGELFAIFRSISSDSVGAFWEYLDLFEDEYNSNPGFFQK